MTTRRTLPALLGLLAVTAVWGSTFPLLKDAVGHLPAADYLALRFALATVVLVVLRPGALVGLAAAQWRRGVLLGVLFSVAQLLQTVGLQHTSASVSGFVTGMYVVLTPLFGAALLRRPVPGSVWAAVALAGTGLAVLSLRGLGIGGGELLTLVSAAFFALHILGTGAWARPRSLLGLTIVQAGTTALLTGCAAAVTGPGGLLLPTDWHALSTPSTGRDWLGLVYMGVIAGALTMVLQTWAQSHLPAERAAVVMTLEPVWAGAFAVAVAGEVLSWRMLVGGVLVLAAMYLCERPPAVPVQSTAAAVETSPRCPLPGPATTATRQTPARRPMQAPHLTPASTPSR